MNEIKIIQMQLERQALSLSLRIDAIYSALYELKRLTLLLFELTVKTEESIETWLVGEEFEDNEDLYVSLKHYMQYINGSISEKTPAYYWPILHKNNNKLRHRLYALRNIGETVQEIREKLKSVTYVYYQDIEYNAGFGWPYVNMDTLVPSNFKWSEYHSCLSVSPDNNPDRVIKWSAPNLSYGDDDVITIVSIPIYSVDDFIGVWSIDVPLKSLRNECVLDNYLLGQTIFIINADGNVIYHPEMTVVQHSDVEGHNHKNLNELGAIYRNVDVNKMINEANGRIEVSNDDGETYILLFHVVPEIEWIIISSFPLDRVFSKVRDEIAAAFNVMKGKERADVIDIDTYDDMQVIVDSYNEMVKVLAYKEKEKEKALQESLKLKDKVSHELENLVRSRTYELEKLNAELSQLADSDSLTGLYNRRKFFALVGKYKKKVSEIDQCSLLLIDIDKFKVINDTYGHYVGDEVLVEFSNQLASNIREGDVLARLGGEEFALFLPYTNGNQAELVAEKLRAVIESNDWSHNASVTISIGISKYESNLCEAIRKADIALYKAKDMGRNRVVTYEMA